MSVTKMCVAGVASTALIAPRALVQPSEVSDVDGIDVLMC